jgi:hypothetical protein
LDEDFNFAIGTEVYPERLDKDGNYLPGFELTPYMPDFSKINDLSEFIFGVGINIHGTEEEDAEGADDRTPVEYYMDNVIFILDNGTGLIEFKPVLAPQVWGVQGGIMVNTFAPVAIYGIDGRLVKQTVANNQIINLPSGLYIVKVGTAKAVKVVVR